MARATLLFEYKGRQGDLLVQIVLWRLPRATEDRPHGLKYRLHLGRRGRTLIRYDNETGKGDHRHFGSDKIESSYEFRSIQSLLDDFRRDCESFGWRWVE